MSGFTPLTINCINWLLGRHEIPKSGRAAGRNCAQHLRQKNGLNRIQESFPTPDSCRDSSRLQTGFRLRLLLTTSRHCELRTANFLRSITSYESECDNFLNAVSPPASDSDFRPPIHLFSFVSSFVHHAAHAINRTAITRCPRVRRPRLANMLSRFCESTFFFEVPESADLHHHTLSPLNFLSDYNEMVENRAVRRGEYCMIERCSQS